MANGNQGFEITNKKIPNSDEIVEKFKADLFKLFPNMNAERLTVLDLNLYVRIDKFAKENGLDNVDLIHSWGYSFKSRKNISMTLEEILNEILIMYPDKIIESIGNLKSRNDTMYQRLMFLLNRKMTPSEYLITNGFTFKNRQYKIVSTREYDGIANIKFNGAYDKFAVTELITHYIFNQKKFSELVNVSRELIRQSPIRHKIKNINELFMETFEEDELDAVFKTIDKRLFENVENGITVLIIKKKEQSNMDYSDCAIIVVKNYTAKCFLFIPDYINEKIELKGLLKYDKKDFSILNYMDSNETCYDIDEEEKIEFIGEDVEKLIRIGFSAYNSTHTSVTRNEYIEYLTGYELTMRGKSYKEILEVIKRNIYDEENGYVSVTSSNDNKSDYMKLRRAYKAKELPGIAELISSYGYIFNPLGVKNKGKGIRKVSNILNEYIEVLEKYYKVEDNKVFLKSNDIFTKRLCQYALNHNMSFNVLLNKMGFSKMTRKELPENFIYTPYFAEARKRKPNTLVDKVLDIINEIEIDDVIDLTGNDNLNYDIRKVADMEDKTIDEWLEMHKYTRKDSGNTDVNTGVNSEIVTKENAEEDVTTFDDKLLNEIKSIQGSLNINISYPEKKVERNQELVSKLKRLYNYRCQLCDPKGKDFLAPLIEMKNGRAYVELHHIKQISDALLPENAEDESSKELDYYTNAIILCSHHHAYIHYHKGGFKELHLNDNSELCLISSEGYTLKIYTNKHLKID